ncbi:MAG: hypothetical protein Q8922_06310 [Bacteroidota bacterium]|nr:hypothetical protein [Bacteroidota bacterium]MDP4233771.1 hypothetical protein [Bacteroidota bacterium]MDP4242410.1 hypothetical protein [Bacteroidota bacterium]MDP4287532.1 hypothetical protein [Bacteroidota bacterium]
MSLRGATKERRSNPLLGRDCFVGLLRYRSAILLAMTLSCGLSSVAFAQDSKYAGAFLEIPVGSRALAMGGAYTAIANDEAAFHWNPAGVSLVSNRLIGFMYSSEYGTPGSALANFYQLGLTYPMKDMTIAANWVRLSVGDLMHTPDITDSLADRREQIVREIAGGAPDYFSDNEDAIVLSVARNNRFTLDWGWLYYKQKIEVPIGVNFKIIHQGIGSFGSASGIGVDAGIMLRFSVAEFTQMPALGKISLGTSVTDIGGTRLNWSTQRTQVVPMHINGGIAYAQPLPLLHTIATFSSDFLIGEAEKPRFGLEMMYDSIVALRAGLDRGLFATGAGFNWHQKIDVNYSLSINTALGPEHRLSFSFNIDNLLKREDTSE